MALQGQLFVLLGVARSLHDEQARKNGLGSTVAAKIISAVLNLGQSDTDALFWLANSPDSGLVAGGLV